MNGFLRVKVYTSKRMFPIKNARINISEIRNGKKVNVADVLTDESGITPDIPLPVSENLKDEKSGRAYAVYIIKTEEEAYKNEDEHEAKIFESAVTIHEVELVLKETVAFSGGD